MRMKKKIMAAVSAMMLCACTGTKPEPVPEPGQTDEPVSAPDQEDEMVDGVLFKKDPEYCRLSLRMEYPGDGLTAEISVIKPDGTELYSYQTRSDYEDVSEYAAYACQESGYYGPIRFSVTFRGPEKEYGEVKTDIFEASEYLPAEETVDHTGKKLTIFRWSRQKATSYVEELKDTFDSFDIYAGKKETTFYGYWYDNSGKGKTVERKMKDSDLETFMKYIENGIVKRKDLMDPYLQVLDAPMPEVLRAEYEGFSSLEKKWYEFSMDREEKKAMLEAVYQYCRTGKWPS